MLRIYSRAEWGARYRDGYDSAPIPASEIYAHHSVTTQLAPTATFVQEVAEMLKLEQIGESNFRAGISYSFLIFPSGRVYEGHSIRRAGAHTIGHNYTGRAICFVGNYEVNQLTQAQLNSAATLLVHGNELGWWSRRSFTGGHRDVYQTACPGANAYRMLPEINRRAAAGGDDMFSDADRDKLNRLNAFAAESVNAPNGETWHDAIWANRAEVAKVKADLAALKVTVDKILAAVTSNPAPTTTTK